MNLITDAATLARALDSPIGDNVKDMLRLRHDQLLAGVPDHQIGDLAHFVVVEVGDDIPAIESAAGYPVVTTQAFDWVLDHGGIYEAACILDDDGFAIVLICMDDDAIDAELLALLRYFAEPADTLAARPHEQARATAT